MKGVVLDERSMLMFLPDTGSFASSQVDSSSNGGSDIMALCLPLVTGHTWVSQLRVQC